MNDCREPLLLSHLVRVSLLRINLGNWKFECRRILSCEKKSDGVD